MISSVLEQIIIQKIKTNGAIPFDEFMRIALYEPEFGYYMRKEMKIGREGDFFTASHLGKVFGIILSKAITKFWQNLGSPEEFSVTEVGPGMGYLAEDILEEFEKEGIFLNWDFTYNLVEINEKLTELQRQRLKNYKYHVKWYSSIESLAALQGIVICNEIFDALPVRIFEVKRGEALEVYLDINQKGELIEILLPARRETVDYLIEFAPHVLELDSYRSEVNLEMKEFIEKISFALKKGNVLIFDYGFDSEEYYSPQRTKGTLLCYYKHSINENPYLHIGQQDITAHINFSALKKWSKEAGFTLEDCTWQSKFLVSMCDEALLERLRQEGLIDKFKRLVLPQGMGETHRVLVLSKF
ncbi:MULTISPECIES: class I SAM-dependent methyltransferase [Thermodesulfovibrio]|uniref:class I SAM-dependent methyltransferase n=1 Tax=Thermodesulfovibrio TaxID=28261 RepID=UPI00262F7892|nr:SAM-dependent methyltransferase [Thermodesulfovibrio sp.]